MTALMRPSLGILGRIVAILLLTFLIEFGVSTLLYEQSSRFLIREDEARRLAEHLVIARKLVSERPTGERTAISRELTTDRYEVRWTQAAPPEPRLAPALTEMQERIAAWEPELRAAGLRLALVSPGHNTMIVGGLRLPDGTWLNFAMREVPHGWDLALGRITLALVPAIALFLVAALLIGGTLRPLRLLSRATERIGLGEEVRLPENGAFEVRRLIRSFNAMQQRIRGLIDDRTQALAAVGHDLRTPLARLQLRLEGIEDPATRTAVAADVAEMDGMVASLLAFLGGEDDPEQPVAADLAVMAATLVDAASDAGADASYGGAEHLVWRFRPIAMRRAIGNLLENAIHYGDRAELIVERIEEGARLRVLDHGPGIPADELEAVREPFHRLDQARTRNTKGLGLGLAIASRAIEREGGTLRLTNRPEGGLCAEILLRDRQGA